MALQINNWNEDRKTVQAAKVHLNNLVEAIQDDSIFYVNASESSLFRYYSSQYLLRMADEVPYDLKADGHEVKLSMAIKYGEKKHLQHIIKNI